MVIHIIEPVYFVVYNNLHIGQKKNLKFELFEFKEKKRKNQMATKDNLRTRFDYNQSKSNEMLMKKRKELERFMNRKEKHNKHVNNESCYRFVRNTITVLVVILAIIYTWFTHYPEPAISPFLHGWQEMGKQFIYRSQYDIFYIGKHTHDLFHHKNDLKFFFFI